MYVAYTCDNNFVWIMGISMISLFENNKGIDDLNVYLLGDNVSEDNKHILKEIASKYDRTCTIVDVPDLKIPESLTSKRWPKSAFTRMFSGELMPKEADRMLYLDCDVIVRGKIGELQTMDMHGYAICAVKDCVSMPYKKKIGVANGDNYVNAGVLLMDLNKMRELDIRSMMSDFMDTHMGVISYADQDVLNGMFKGKFGELPPVYDVMTQMCCYTYKQIQQWRRPSNYYSREVVEYAQKNPVIIHYTTCLLNIRPWCEGSKHPWAGEFWKYQSMSPWKDKPRSVARFEGWDHKVMKMLLALPDFISYRFIGFIHAVIRPLMIMVTGKN